MDQVPSDLDRGYPGEVTHPETRVRKGEPPPPSNHPRYHQDVEVHEPVRPAARGTSPYPRLDALAQGQQAPRRVGGADPDGSVQEVPLRRPEGWGAVHPGDRAQLDSRIPREELGGMSQAPKSMAQGRAEADDGLDTTGPHCSRSKGRVLRLWVSQNRSAWTA